MLGSGKKKLLGGMGSEKGTYAVLIGDRPSLKRCSRHVPNNLGFSRQGSQHKLAYRLMRQQRLASIGVFSSSRILHMIVMAALRFGPLASEKIKSSVLPMAWRLILLGRAVMGL